MSTFLLRTIQKSPRARAHLRAPPWDADRAGRPCASLPPHCAQRRTPGGAAKGCGPSKAPLRILTAALCAASHTWGRRVRMQAKHGALAHPYRRAVHNVAHVGAPPKDAGQAGGPLRIRTAAMCVLSRVWGSKA